MNEEQTDQVKIPEPSKELRQLIDSFFSDTLSRVEFARLEELLEESPAARSYYLRVSSIESLVPAALADCSGSKEVEPVPECRFKWCRIGAMVAGLAGLVGITCYLFVGESSEPPRSSELDLITKSDEAYVTLTNLIGVTWVKESQVIKRGDLINGSFAIASGVLEMTYENGVSLIIEGPARYTVTGSNSGRLDFGTIVADVPPAGYGFELEYGDDKLVDFGTQFGVRLLENDSSPEVVVFKGQVEVQSKLGKSSRLMGGHAIRKFSDEFQSIPINRNHYLRELPSREFPWEMRSVLQGERVTFEFDATNLIRRAGDYRCVFKWMNGPNRLLIERVELRRDGVLVSEDVHDGVTGLVQNTFDNIYHVTVGDGDSIEGKWTLHALVHCALPKSGQLRSVDTMGVLLIQEVSEEPPSLESYLGQWEYWHDGLEWKRVFREDGKMELYRQGLFVALGDWSYDDGFVSVMFPMTGAAEIVLLESQNTLIFVNQPYLNAIAVSDSQ